MNMPLKAHYAIRFYNGLPPKIAGYLIRNGFTPSFPVLSSTCSK